MIDFVIGIYGVREVFNRGLILFVWVESWVEGR